MTEPGWKDREVERPRLLRKWVERCDGGASVPMLAACESMIFPPDLLDWFLATQRPAPAADRNLVAASIGATATSTPAPDCGPQVIRLEDFRRGRTP